MEKGTLTFRMPGEPSRTVRGSWSAVSGLFTVLANAGVTDLAIGSETDAEGRALRCTCPARLAGYAHTELHTADCLAK